MRVASVALSFRRAAISRSVPVPSFSFARSFATYKTSTGLAGVDVDPDALNTVHKLSKQILENVKVYSKIYYFFLVFYGYIISLNLYACMYRKFLNEACIDKALKNGSISSTKLSQPLQM